jgi:hypothetical protein
MPCHCSSETPLLDRCNIFTKYPANNKIITNRHCPLLLESLEKFFGTYCRFGYLEGQLNYLYKIFGKNYGDMLCYRLCHYTIQKKLEQQKTV